MNDRTALQMPHENDLAVLHENIMREIIEEREQEMKALRALKQKARKAAEERDQNESLKAAGLDVDKLDKLHCEYLQQAEREIQTIESQMEEQSRKVTSDAFGVDVDATFLPAGAKRLTPVWVAGFSDADGQTERAGASVLAPQAILTGGGCKNYYNWAKGGGWGCTDGTGKNQSWIDFGFWFKPSESRFYSVRPLFRYRGYYIVKADDAWYNCKSARVKVTQWVNVKQYNWKGWKSETVLDVSDDNITVNKRFDDDRHMYTSYLLGAGDWAYIRCTIGLYVEAEGGGSYAKNDYSTGNANFLCAPHCHVY
ncbi:MAG: hypothetical protein L0H73_07520 [Nitrococcus sp.]|nr:hypothetical protein [Nitrococcus sp.]